MRVILSLLSSHSAERQAIWLQAGQSLSVGRTDHADFSVPDDPHLSGVHFELKCTRAHCELRDLESTGGTFVGQQQVASAVLQDGDTIRAGETEFLIRIEGDDPTAQPVRQAVPATANVHRRPRQPPVYRQREFDPPRLCWQNAQPEPTPAEVFSILSAAMRPCLLVDFIALERPIPPELAEPVFLYNWLPPEVAAGLSPVFISSDDPVELPELVAAGWGHDALMVFCSQVEPAVTLAHLRHLARGARSPMQAGKTDQEAAEEKLVALAWPSLFVPLLENASPDEFEFLFSRLDAVFFEGDSADDWQLFTITATVDRLHQLGFRRDPHDVSAPVFEPDEPDGDVAGGETAPN